MVLCDAFEDATLPEDEARNLLSNSCKECSFSASGLFLFSSVFRECCVSVLASCLAITRSAARDLTGSYFDNLSRYSRRSLSGSPAVTG